MRLSQPQGSGPLPRLRRQGTQARRVYRVAPRREGEHAQAGHLQSGTTIRGPGQILASPKHYLIAKLHLLRVHGLGQLDQGIRLHALLLHAGRQQLCQGDAMEQGFQLGMELIKIRPQGRYFPYLGHGGLGILAQHRLQQLVQVVVVQGAEHGEHARLPHPAVAVGQGLIGEAQGIAHAAIGRLGQGLQGARLEGLPLLLQHPGQLLGDQPLIQALQVELQATGEDGDG